MFITISGFLLPEKQEPYRPGSSLVSDLSRHGIQSLLLKKYQEADLDSWKSRFQILYAKKQEALAYRSRQFKVQSPVT